MQTYSQPDPDILYARIQDLRSEGIDPYATSFSRSHTLLEVLDEYEQVGSEVPSEDVSLKLCGRFVGGTDAREFITIEDQYESLTLYLDEDHIGKARMQKFRETVCLGDYLGFDIDLIYGEPGEKAIAQVADWYFLAPCVMPIPKPNTISLDRQRQQRHVHLASNINARTDFIQRGKVLQYMRRFLEENCFTEINTPPLPLGNAAGASRRDAYLKHILIGGVERVYEIAHNLHDQRIDWLHHPMAQMMHCSMMLANVEEVMRLTERLIVGMTQHLHATLIILWRPLDQMKAEAKRAEQFGFADDPNAEKSELDLDFTPAWSRRPVTPLVRDITGIDFAEIATAAEAVLEARSIGVQIAEGATFASVGEVMMETVKQVVGPALIQPTFLTELPSDDDRRRSSFQLYINGIKFADGYSESGDPLNGQHTGRARARLAADDAARTQDGEYLTALKYGLPPSGGLTLNVERLVMVMLNKTDIRDVIPFPV